MEVVSFAVDKLKSVGEQYALDHLIAAQTKIRRDFSKKISTQTELLRYRLAPFCNVPYGEVLTNKFESLESSSKILDHEKKRRQVYGHLQKLFSSLNGLETAAKVDSKSIQLAARSLKVLQNNLEQQKQKLAEQLKEEQMVLEKTFRDTKKVVGKFEKEISKAISISKVLAKLCANQPSYQPVAEKAEVILAKRSKLVETLDKVGDEWDVLVYAKLTEAARLSKEYLCIRDDLQGILDVCPASSVADVEPSQATEGSLEAERLTQKSYKEDDLDILPPFEFNPKALQVVKRVKDKLDGRDDLLSGHDQKISIVEHVDLLIRAATNEESLATIYEGWMSWI